jgi:hypothetical protein
VNGKDSLQRAIGEWQRKHHIADGDPIIAVLELVRLQLQHASHERDGAQTAPPSFEEFRGTVELLDRRSKAFISQAADLIAELRRFGQNVQRLNRFRFAVVVLMTALGVAAGLFAGRWL